MFDIGASELLLIAIVAIVAIGPKDLPLALRTAGRWIAKVRRVSGHFRSGVETMIREAELEEMEKKWREQNEAIMAANPSAPAHPEPVEGAEPADGPEAAEAYEPVPGPEPASAEAAVKPAAAKRARRSKSAAEPQLPLSPP
jgi:sec-independent protein translocase protein TatB